jgi:capsular exopolysaccharide synthesis family protein
VLGFVAEMKYKSKSPEEIYVSRQPRSPISEAFRSLRTNLEFAAVQKPIHTILVTSPGPSEGKTTVAVNLAAIFELSGKTVALLDADMRRPHVHRFMGLPNRDGLSNLFRSQAGIASVMRTRLELPNLMIITSGSLPPNPAEVLSSEKMTEVMEDLKNHADVVIIDSPPFLLADASLLAARADGVLLVVQSNKTHLNAALSMTEQLNRVGARVVGVALNRMNGKDSFYYYSDLKHYNSYAYDVEKTQPSKKGP